MTEPLRFTKQLSSDWWVTRCHACPRRFGKKSFPTEQAADDWWANHIREPVHLKSVENDGQPTALEIKLAALFGQDAPSAKRVPPSERAGRLTVRPDTPSRYHAQDNPRGT